MISIRDLSVSGSQGSRLLHNISTDFLPGKIHAVMGLNGSGKTTLLRAICQLQKPYDGIVTIDGNVAKDMNELALARKISWTESEHHSPFAYRVADIIQWGRWPHHQGQPTRSDRDIIETAAKDLGIDHKIHRPVSGLSLGERKKTFLAKSLASHAPYLLWDEPCGALDTRAAVDLMRLVRREIQQEKTVIMSIHDIDLALCFADCITLLVEGALTWQGTPRDVDCRPALSHAFRLQLNDCWGNPDKYKSI